MSKLKEASLEKLEKIITSIPKEIVSNEFLNEIFNKITDDEIEIESYNEFVETEFYTLP